MSAATLHHLPTVRGAAVPTAALDALRTLEAELEAEWERLQRDGHGYEGLRAALAAKDGAADPEALREADRAQEAFLARLDDYQRRMHTHFMDQVVRELDHAVRTLRDFYGSRRARSVLRAHRRLAKLAERYHELEPLYGTNRDHRRIAVYQRFYAGVVAFSERIRRLDPTAPEGRLSFASHVSRFGRAVSWRLRRIPAVARLLWAGLRLVGCVLAKRSDGPGTPFTRRVDEFFRTLGEVQGYRVEVSGREQLAEATSPDTVTLFTPTHRHGITDNVTFSHLRTPDYLVFNAVDQLPVVPRFLKDRAANTRGLVAVGGGRGSSVDRALAAIAEGVSRNVLIYPEGSVSEGFGGTRPPRENFGEGLVRRIREAGHPLRIAPITYRDNARFLDLPPVSASPEERRLRVEVSPPLEDDAVAALLGAGGGAMVNRVLRLAWLERLVTDERRFLGHDRVAAVEARLDRELDGVRYWGSAEPAPVTDRLETKGSEPLVVRDEPFHGKRVRVLDIPASAREPDGKIALPDLAREGSHELLIGIRDPSHIYLNVGSRRFDGDIFRPLRVRERDYVYPGIVIRLVGVPVKSLNAIRRQLEELSGREYRTLTCANSACRVIARAANIEIDDGSDMRPFLPSHVLPTRTMRKLIERGVRDHAGGAIETQIYRADEDGRSLEEILSDMRREEIRIARDHLDAITVDAWGAVKAAVGRAWKRLRKRGGPDQDSSSE